jgi:DNA-binding NarL/FixJ family response regulator
VLLADDHPVFREGLGLMLGALHDLEVVGRAVDGHEAVALARETSPDVVVLDIGMPGLNGIEAARQIHDHDPEVGILMLTMYDDDESVFAALRAGALGYVLKGADGEEIHAAVRAVGRGEAIFGPALARRIVDFFAAGPIRPVAPEGPAFPELTARENEILDLVAAGHSNQAIAALLFLSHKTVRNHVSSIFAKLQVADRAQAIVRARAQGLGVRQGERG